MSQTTGILTPEILVMHGFDFAIPEILTPGGLAIVAHSAMSKKFSAFREHRVRRLWYVRGDLREEPLFPPCFSVQPTSLLSKAEGQMWVSTFGSRISSEALSFRPISNEKNEVVAFGLQRFGERRRQSRPSQRIGRGFEA